MTHEGFKLYDFLVDSGADFTLLPRRFASEIGINLKRCEPSTTLGVEGRGITIYHSSVVLRIGNYQSKIRCAFAQHDRIPPLLGRLDVFSKYNITFHARRRSIIFQPAVK
ncbi:MAG: retropepsin-like domain-containing protein [Deltaproteobacteria bacterium]|nr:retropepsin-like domain-containing protein [Deltaproteobacteria bacterium]